MSYLKDNWCLYCKEEILEGNSFVYIKGKYYHLTCYHTMIDMPLELEEDVEDNF